MEEKDQPINNDVIEEQAQQPINDDVIEEQIQQRISEKKESLFDSIKKVVVSLPKKALWQKTVWR